MKIQAILSLLLSGALALPCGTIPLSDLFTGDSGPLVVYVKGKHTQPEKTCTAAELLEDNNKCYTYVHRRIYLTGVQSPPAGCGPFDGWCYSCAEGIELTNTNVDGTKCCRQQNRKKTCKGDSPSGFLITAAVKHSARAPASAPCATASGDQQSESGVSVGDEAGVSYDVSLRIERFNTSLSLDGISVKMVLERMRDYNQTYYDDATCNTPLALDMQCGEADGEPKKKSGSGSAVLSVGIAALLLPLVVMIF